MSRNCRRGEEQIPSCKYTQQGLICSFISLHGTLGYFSLVNMWLLFLQKVNKLYIWKEHCFKCKEMRQSFCVSAPWVLGSCVAHSERHGNQGLIAVSSYLFHSRPPTAVPSAQNLVGTSTHQRVHPCWHFCAVETRQWLPSWAAKTQLGKTGISLSKASNSCCAGCRLGRCEVSISFVEFVWKTLQMKFSLRGKQRCFATCDLSSLTNYPFRFDMLLGKIDLLLRWREASSS